MSEANITVTVSRVWENYVVQNDLGKKKENKKKRMI